MNEGDAKDGAVGEAFRPEGEGRGDHHSRDGWHWHRGEDGSVRVYVLTADGQTMIDHALTPNEWASVVASVSLGGEDAATYAAALDFHGGKVAGDRRMPTALEDYQRQPSSKYPDLSKPRTPSK